MDLGRTLGAGITGGRRDSLVVLLASALVAPLAKAVGASPIIGFLVAGMALGPAGASIVADVHTTEILAELGIDFFLFEMGLELSVARLMSMKRDVFGLGLAQFTVTTGALAWIASRIAPGLNAAALLVIGGGLALSSSAFVLQLLRDADELGTRHGRAAFGILLFQDLAVVPLLIAVPLLARGSFGGRAAMISLAVAAGRAFGVLGLVATFGRTALDSVFNFVARTQSTEAFLSCILLTVLGMSALTDALGLSASLGAFMAGVLLSETRFRYQVESDIAPFRGLLLGLFFMTVGFSIDLGFLIQKWPAVFAALAGLVATKAAIVAALVRLSGASSATAVHAGLLLAQGGEFAFVAFGLASKLNVMPLATSRTLLTATALSMAVTPLLGDLGAVAGKKIEQRAGLKHYVGQDAEADEVKQQEGLVVVCGYGRIGRSLTDLLDQFFLRWVAFDVNPAKAIEARNEGRSVFFGDVSRAELLESFNVGNAKMVIVAMSDRVAVNKCVVSLRRLYPDIPLLVRAFDRQHQERLQKIFGVTAMVPTLPEDSMLLTLPFGGFALKQLGLEPGQVDAVIEQERRSVLLSSAGLGLDMTALEEAQLGIEPKEEGAEDDVEPSGPDDVEPSGPEDADVEGDVVVG
jgi:CPA2 family monovalent cation:H+ antiporter-2